jgi:hypothetical protein
MYKSIKIKPDKFVKSLVNLTFPDYKGRKFFFEVQTHPMDCRSYWDGGSRTYYAFVKLDTLESVSMPSQGLNDKTVNGADSVFLPEGICCVQRDFFQGKDVGVTIIVNPKNSVKFLTE